MTGLLCQRQQLASTLPGSEQVAARNRHANRRRRDERGQLVIVSLNPEVARRSLGHAPLPEEGAGQGRLASCAFGPGQCAGHDCRATQRLRSRQLRGVGSGRCLPYPRGSRERLVLRCLRVRGSFAKHRVRIGRSTSFEHQASECDERRGRGHQRPSSLQRTRNVAQKPLRGRMSAHLPQIDPARTARHVLDDIIRQRLKHRPHRNAGAVHGSRLAHEMSRCQKTLRRHPVAAVANRPDRRRHDRCETTRAREGAATLRPQKRSRAAPTPAPSQAAESTSAPDAGSPPRADSAIVDRRQPRWG